ncbi:MAG: hypothetical protein R3B45_13140 [Bdellovibrionota bacterium]
MLRSALLVSGMMVSSLGLASILPPNDLHLEDNVSKVSDLTEEEFFEITNRVIDFYKPIVASHGATLSVNADWPNSTVNASAGQSGSSWYVNMYGGLARRPEVTRDGYLLVICHELGHHLGGFPFTSGWAANEGQSDYFATHVCAPNIWRNDLEENARYRELVDPVAKEQCDTSWETEEQQNLCYRSAMAGYSLGSLLGALRNTTVAFDTPDTSVVTRTNNRHPEAQCRLDTYVAGAMCGASFDDEVIPGKRFRDRSGLEAENEAYDYSCSRRDQHSDLSTRRLCWYAPRVAGQ